MSALLKEVIADCRREEQSDPVNHPAHYCRGDVECIDAIKAAIQDMNGVEGYHVGNIIKYVWRFKAKGGVQDLEKAAFYLAALIDYADSERTPDGTRSY